MPKGHPTSAAIQQEIVQAVLAGEALQHVALRHGVAENTVGRLTQTAVSQALRPTLLAYLQMVGRVTSPTAIPTQITTRYGIHRAVHVLHDMRKDGLITARLGEGGSRSLRDIELTDRGNAEASRLRPPSQHHDQIDHAIMAVGRPVAPGPVERIIPEPLDIVEDRAPERLVADGDAAPMWPVLESLRLRAQKRTERARLLEQAAELADDEEEGVQLLEQAERARRASNSPIENEYLAFAAHQEGQS
jgi:DNA-binding PadR family transcriptional regulator